MPALSSTKPLNTFTRILLWLASLLLSALLFSVFADRGIPQAIRFIFQFTLFFAMPAWLLYLPVLVKFPGVTRRQLWILAIAGILIGPASLIAWNIILPSPAQSTHSFSVGDVVWRGRGLMMMQAAIVGSLTTVFYLAALRLLQRKST